MRTFIDHVRRCSGLKFGPDVRFITSHAGIQMFDWTGREGGLIAKPQDKATVSLAFAGPNLEYLYVCSSDKIYRRKTKAKGVAADVGRL